MSGVNQHRSNPVWPNNDMLEIKQLWLPILLPTHVAIRAGRKIKGRGGKYAHSRKPALHTGSWDMEHVYIPCPLLQGQGKTPHANQQSCTLLS